MRWSFESDTQRPGRTGSGPINNKSSSLLGAHKRSHFPVGWATMQRAVFRSDILPESTASLRAIHARSLLVVEWRHSLPAFDPVTHKTLAGASSSNWSTPASLITCLRSEELSHKLLERHICPFRIRLGSIMCRGRMDYVHLHYCSLCQDVFGLGRCLSTTEILSKVNIQQENYKNGGELGG